MSVQVLNCGCGFIAILNIADKCDNCGCVVVVNTAKTLTCLISWFWTVSQSLVPVSGIYVFLNVTFIVS